LRIFCKRQLFMIFLYTKDKGRILITGNKSVMIFKTKLVSETHNGQEINYDTVLMIRTLTNSRTLEM
jgi:transcription elongation factor